MDAEESLSLLLLFQIPLKLLGIVLFEIPDNVVSGSIAVNLPEADDIRLQDMPGQADITVESQAIQ